MPAIVVDTREQAPFHFGTHPTISAALDAGDYSLEGLEGRIAIERKAVGDLRGCIGGGRERFVRELERLSLLDFAAVVVEGPLSQVMRQGPHVWKPGARPLHPSSVLGSLTAWCVRYRLPIWLTSNRLEAREVTFRLLRHFHRGEERGEPIRP